MAIWFDGVDDCYTIADDATLTLPAGNWCIGFWSRVTSLFSRARDSRLVPVSSLGGGSYNGVEFRFNESAGALDGAPGGLHALVFGDVFGASVSSGGWNSPALAGDGVWRLIILQRNHADDIFELWVTSPTGHPVRYTSPTYGTGPVDGVGYRIGRSSNPPLAYYYPGEVAELFQGNFLLTRQEITDLARGATITALGKTTTLYLPMVSAEATLIDASGNGNDAIRTGAPRTTPHPIVRPITASSNTTTWTFEIDWNRDGIFDDAGADISAYVMDARWNVGFREQGKDVAGDAQATLTLDNSDRRFSPENVAGPYYGNDWLMRPFRIRAGSTVMYSGWTDGIQPGFGNLNQTAVLKARCMRHLLDLYPIGAFPLLLNVRSDTVARALLDRAMFLPLRLTGYWVLGRPGYSELGTTTVVAGNHGIHLFDPGDETFAYAGDMWDATTSVFSALQDVVSAERGRLFVDRDGRLTFWNRRRMIVNILSGVTLDNTMQGVSYEWGAEIANDIVVNYAPRVVDNGITTLWTLEKEVKVPPGETREVTARYNDDSEEMIAALDVQIPQVSDATLGMTGTGMALVSFEAGATSAKLTFANSGTTTGTVNTSTITGRKVTGRNDASVRVMDRWSQFQNGPRARTISVRMMDDDDDAWSVARYELVKNRNPVGMVRSVRLIVRDAATLEAVINTPVGGRVRLNEAQTQHSAEYFIIGEEHRLTAGTKLHEVTWFTEAAKRFTFWILGRPGYSEVGTTMRPAPL